MFESIQIFLLVEGRSYNREVSEDLWFPFMYGLLSSVAACIKVELTSPTCSHLVSHSLHRHFEKLLGRKEERTLSLPAMGDISPAELLRALSWTADVR